MVIISHILFLPFPNQTVKKAFNFCGDAVTDLAGILKEVTGSFLENPTCMCSHSIISVTRLTPSFFYPWCYFWLFFIKRNIGNNPEVTSKCFNVTSYFSVFYTLHTHHFSLNSGIQTFMNAGVHWHLCMMETTLRKIHSEICVITLTFLSKRHVLC